MKKAFQTLYEMNDHDANRSLREIVELAGLDPKEHFRGMNLRGIDLSGEDLSGYDFSESDFTDANLMGADLRESTLVNADLTRARLQHAKLAKANLTGCIFCETEVAGADFHHADLSSAKVEKSSFWDASITGTCFHDVEWNRACFRYGKGNVSKQTLNALLSKLPEERNVAVYIGVKDKSEVKMKKFYSQSPINKPTRTEKSDGPPVTQNTFTNRGMGAALYYSAGHVIVGAPRAALGAVVAGTVGAMVGRVVCGLVLSAPKPERARLESKINVYVEEGDHVIFRAPSKERVPDQQHVLQLGVGDILGVIKGGFFPSTFGLRRR